MNKKNFGLVGRFMNCLGVYDLIKRLSDVGLWPSSHYRSDFYRYSTGSFIIKQFSGHIGHLADHRTGYLGFGLIHYSIISLHKPERVLCIGSEQGFIPAIFAMACKDNGKGQVDFVDAGKDVGEPGSWGGKGFWKKIDPHLHFSPYDLNKYVTTYVMTSVRFAKKYQRKYDYIYIDADHSYEGVKRDYELFWPRLVSGGIMAFHDIGLRGLSSGEEYGVWKLWQELNNKNKMEFIKGDFSLGLIRKDS